MDIELMSYSIKLISNPPIKKVGILQVKLDIDWKFSVHLSGMQNDLAMSLYLFMN